MVCRVEALLRSLKFCMFNTSYYLTLMFYYVPSKLDNSILIWLQRFESSVMSQASGINTQQQLHM